MTEMMNRIYYMVSEQIGQQCARDPEMKILMRRKCALIDEIALRIGEDGGDLVEAMSDLDASLSDIQNKALFRAALSLGVEVARPQRGA